MNKSVIIVAAGSGTRMKSSIPKQFMLLNGKPILMHTIQRFYDYNRRIKIILVLPEQETGMWKKLLTTFSFSISHTIVTGGKTRYESVKNGLEKITEPCIVAVHDGVRPLCTPSLIGRCFDDAEKFTNAIPAVRITESVREVLSAKNVIVDRENLRIVQTPQCFNSELLKKAYENNNPDNFTDDASVFEKAGNPIHLVEGERNNLKITVLDDIRLASILVKEMFGSKSSH